MPTRRDCEIMDFSKQGNDKKASKPLMEKRRRARINHSLAQLKSLVIDPNTTERSRQAKLEKADILELTVRHLHEIKRRQKTADSLDSSHPKKKFELGYSECVREVELFLDNLMDPQLVGVDSDLQKRLKDHLSRRLNDIYELETLNQTTSNTEQSSSDISPVKPDSTADSSTPSPPPLSPCYPYEIPPVKSYTKIRQRREDSALSPTYNSFGSDSRDKMFGSPPSTRSDSFAESPERVNSFSNSKLKKRREDSASSPISNFHGMTSNHKRFGSSPRNDSFTESPETILPMESDEYAHNQVLSNYNNSSPKKYGSPPVSRSDSFSESPESNLPMESEAYTPNHFVAKYNSNHKRFSSSPGGSLESNMESEGYTHNRLLPKYNPPSLCQNDLSQPRDLSISREGLKQPIHPGSSAIRSSNGHITLAPRRLPNGDWALVLPGNVSLSEIEGPSSSSAFRLVLPSSEVDKTRQVVSPLSSSVSDLSSCEEYCGVQELKMERMEVVGGEDSKFVWRPW